MRAGAKKYRGTMDWRIGMRRWMMALVSLLVAATHALAQADEVPQAARSHAAIMILLLVVVGVMLTYALLWVLRAMGKLPEEKPMPRPRWVHPDDENDAG